ncbi:unnamed protein product, partial [Porites evermanni]
MRYILWVMALLEACDVTNNSHHLGFYRELENRFSLCPVDIAMRLSALCVVLSLLVVFFLIPEVTSCYVKVNGCSIPGDLSFFYKTKFRLACDKHDVCYYCVRLISF